MTRLSKLIFLLVLLPALLCFARGDYYKGVSVDTSFDCTPYDICQHFNGTGYDNGESWTENGQATINEDYNAAPLEGTHSLNMIDGGTDPNVYVSVNHADGATTYVYFRIKVLVDNDANGYIMNLYDYGDLAMTLRLETDGTLRIYHGSTTAVGSTDIDGGTEFHVWVDWKTENGTDTDGVAHLYVSATGTKPAAEITMENGEANFPNIDRVYFWAAGGSISHVIDRVLIDDSAIGNQP